jgi:D-tyrosyl-tRNA(Tyr) deacylase
MRAVVQRVARAEVRIDGAVVGAIGRGLLVLLGAAQEDTLADVDWMVDKVVGLRVFADEAGLMNRSLLEVGGALLVVSQFTLLGDARKGRRPSFVAALAPGPAEALYRRFLELAAATGASVERGRFGADMQVELVNDGPVTLLLDSRRLF